MYTSRSMEKIQTLMKRCKDFKTAIFKETKLVRSDGMWEYIQAMEETVVLNKGCFVRQIGSSELITITGCLVMSREWGPGTGTVFNVRLIFFTKLNI